MSPFYIETNWSVYLTKENVLSEKTSGEKSVRSEADTPGAGLRLKMKPCVLEGVDTTEARRRCGV